MELWKNDKIQFARLLAEIRAAGLDDETWQVVAESMDLTEGEIREILERAEAYWDSVKLLPHSSVRTVEYYRCWDGNSGGDWDTDFIEIPADTPDDQLDAAVQAAARSIDWTDSVPPVFVGFYATADYDE